MEITDTIRNIHNLGDSVTVVTHHISEESHGLTGYMTDTPSDIITPTSVPDWTVVSNLGFQSALIGIVFVVIALALIIWGYDRFIGCLSKRSLKVPFLLIWLYGFVVYDVGMCTGQHISLVTNAPMAIIYAFKIFLFDSDVSEIHGAFHENWFYSLNFALAHFLADALSTLVIIKLFGFTIVQRVRMWWASIKPSRKEPAETFVIWNPDEACYHLIEDIIKQYKDTSAYRIVIVRTNTTESDADDNVGTMSRIFNFLSLKSSELDRLSNLRRNKDKAQTHARVRCYTNVSHKNLGDINVSGDEQDIIGSVLRMKSLRRTLKKKTGKGIHMLFLSDNEEQNLHAVEIFLNDKTITDFVKETESALRREVAFYCHARYNSVHRVIEDQNSTESIRVKVVDTSHLSVEMLKATPETLPVNYVDVKSDGKVSSAFNALVIGFSEVGQDSVRFLYEFGAFVDSESTPDNVLRSPFHLDVVDKKMKDLAGAFMANAPAISVRMVEENGNCTATEDIKTALITLHNLDCNSIGFYEMVTQKLKELNYIVIATNNDELNISLGVRIFKLAMRIRENLDNFIILVRAHNDDDGHLRKITQYYNRLYVAQGKDFNSTGTQTDIGRHEKLNTPLNLFGLDKEIYTYGNIIDDTIESEAAKYKEEYCVASGDQENIATDSQEMAWHKDYIKYMQLDENHKEYSPTYGGIMRLRRTRNQDIANYLHKLTKEIIAERAIASAQDEKIIDSDIEWSQYSRIPKQIKYLKDGRYLDDYATRLLTVLAQMEHFRWCAAHEILGYTRAGEIVEKDEVRMTHSCLCAYKKFDQNNPEHVKTLSYDNSVVDLTLGVSKAAEK